MMLLLTIIPIILYNLVLLLLFLSILIFIMIVIITPSFINISTLLNYNHNFGLYAVLNSSLLGLLYYSSYYYSSLLFFFLLIFVLSYYLLYTWRGLLLGVTSYICSLVNFTFFNLFLLGLYNVFFSGLPNPIYVEDLSAFSYYRYITFLVITILGICIYFFIKFYPSLSFLVEKITHPYLKEETRKLLTTWENGFIGDICCNLFDSLLILRYRYIFFSAHFILFYCVRVIQTLLFFNFIFLHGDLRYNLYLLPLSFLIWILRFFDYYFFCFIKAYITYLCNVLHVTSGNMHVREDGFIHCNLKDLSYTITAFGYKEGFIHGHILFKQWLDFADVYVFILRYKHIGNILSMFILVINISSWSYVLSLNSTETIFTITPLFKRLFSSTIPKMAPPRHARHLKETHQHKFNTETAGAFAQGHPVYGDYDSYGNFKAEGSLTHGPGSVKNPSTPIAPYDFSGKRYPTNAIPFDEPKVIPPSLVKPELLGSAKFFERPGVKEKVDNLHGIKDKE